MSVYSLLVYALCKHIVCQGVPGKGKVLTGISLFWFDKLKEIIPTHFVTAKIDEMPEEVKQYRDRLEGRTMLVKRAKVIPIEAIVRGYLTGIWAPDLLACAHSSLTGSGWAEYKNSGTVHGISMPPGLVESQKLPKPLFTPSTKAEQGQHDENISPQQGTRNFTRKLR